MVIKDILSRLCHQPSSTFFRRLTTSVHVPASSVRPERHSQATNPTPGSQDALGCVEARLIGWQALDKVRRPALPRLNGQELQTASAGSMPSYVLVCEVPSHGSIQTLSIISNSVLLPRRPR